MQSKRRHPHRLLVSLRMLEVKAPGGKSSPNIGTDLTISHERQPRAMIHNRRCRCFTVLQSRLQPSAGVFKFPRCSRFPVPPLHFLSHRCTEQTTITLSYSVPPSYLALVYSQSTYLPFIHLYQAHQLSPLGDNGHVFFRPPVKAHHSTFQSTSF